MVGKSYGMFAPRKHECGFSAVIWQFEGEKKKKKEEEEEDTSAGRYGKMGGFELGQSDCGSK